MLLYERNLTDILTDGICNYRVDLLLKTNYDKLKFKEIEKVGGQLH